MAAIYPEFPIPYTKISRSERDRGQISAVVDSIPLRLSLNNTGPTIKVSAVGQGDGDKAVGTRRLDIASMFQPLSIMAACCHSGSDYAIDGVGLIYVHADWEITNHVSDKAGTVFPLVGMTGDPDINHLNALMVLLANPKSIVIVGLDGIPRTLGNVIEPTHFKVHDGVMFDLMAQGPGLMINTVALQNAMRKVISEVVSHLEASILGCDDLFTRYIMGVQVASLFKFPIVDINGGVEYKHFYGYVFETEMSRSEISLLARSVSHEGATVPNSNKILDFETSRLLLSSCAATHTSAVKNGWAPNNHADTGKGLIQQLSGCLL